MMMWEYSLRGPVVDLVAAHNVVVDDMVAELQLHSNIFTLEFSTAGITRVGQCHDSDGKGCCESEVHGYLAVARKAEKLRTGSYNDPS